MKCRRWWSVVMSGWLGLVQANIVFVSLRPNSDKKSRRHFLEILHFHVHRCCKIRKQRKGVRMMVCVKKGLSQNTHKNTYVYSHDKKPGWMLTAPWLASASVNSWQTPCLVPHLSALYKMSSWGLTVTHVLIAHQIGPNAWENVARTSAADEA